jgi:hypothetical protein
MVVADAKGNFDVKGAQFEPNYLSPYLRIEHPCGQEDILSKVS